MPELTLHYPDGRTETHRVESGTRLWDAVEPAYRTAPCGGNGRCGKCRVQAAGCLSEPQEQEKSLLGDDLLRGWRLACLTRVTGDAEVTLHQTAQLREICADGELPPFVRQPLFTRYGAAVDIGTTTLAAQLYDHDGRRLAQAVAANPQAMFGADVISRIEKSLAGEREALMRCIRRGIDGLLAELSASAGVSPSDIDAVVVTGNTTMLYLLTGRSVDCLARAPFAADELFGRWAQAGEVELASVPSARVYLPRCMSAFVGADITTALLCSGLCERPDSALLADIGTNGELALWHGGRLRCCSTAAGPVFEGAGISCGMQGVAGAVSHVLWENGAVRCRTIGGGEPRGICGSGIIDAAAVFCGLGIIDETGAFTGGRTDYALATGVTVTQKDIRMLQLGKSAVCAGIRTLLEAAGLTPEALTELSVAGGFGTYLDIRNAAAIGLYPAELEGKTKVLGNAALAGAAMLLLAEPYVQKSCALAQQAETVDLSTSAVFMAHYVDCMEF